MAESGRGWVRSYFVTENRMVGGVVEKYDVCQVKNPENGNLPCGKAYKNGPKYGTSSLLRHLTNVHPTDDEISEGLRLRNINNDGQTVFHYNNLICD